MSANGPTNPFDVADDLQPVIYVHSLGEFEYCPRAGLLAFERQELQPECDDDTVPNLGFSPPMEIAELEERIAGLQQRIATSLVVAVVTFAVGALLSNIGDLIYAVLIWITLVLPLVAAAVAWRDLAVLREEHLRFKNASNDPLDIGARCTRVVDWWQLVKVYEPTRVNASYCAMGIAGKPWRILSSHRDRYPVILSGSDNVQVKSAHRVKLAAYASLIEALEGSRSNWGVVIFKATRTGIAYPLNAEAVSAAKELQNKFRTAIAKSEQGVSPPPGNPNACAKCPFNQRRAYRAGETETRIGDATLMPYRPKGCDTHCDCGDRFLWTPPLDELD